MKRRSSSLIASALLTGASLSPLSAALAQPLEPEASQPLPTPAEAGAPTDERTRIWFSLNAGGTYAFDADVDNDGGTEGRVSVARVPLNAGVAYALDDTWRLTFDVESEFSWYDFDGAGLGVGAGNPGSLETYSVLLSPGASVRLSERWALRFGALFYVGAEFGASDESFTYGGLAGVRYQFSDTLAVTGGLIVITRLEDDPSIYPLIGLEWQITDKVRLTARHLGGELAIDVCPEATITLGGAYEPREYRLNELGGRRGDVLRDNRVPITVGITYHPCKSFEAYVRGGAVVWQEFTVDDRGGDRVSDVNTDPAPFVAAGVTLRF